LHEFLTPISDEKPSINDGKLIGNSIIGKTENKNFMLPQPLRLMDER
jgi:hypothetical protein